MVSSDGAVHLVSAKSKQLVQTLQTSGTDHTGRFAKTQDAKFSPDGNFLHIASEGTGVRVWDVRRRCCVHTWNDRGGLRTTSLATSPDGELIAAGADSGAVNLYRTTEVLSSARPQPVKEFLNLTAAVTTLSFNPTSECLLFASKYMKRALRVAHVPQRSIFTNWPTSKTPLGYVQCCAFSPSGSHVAFGTEKGKALMYAMNHYAS
jgi:U3 small nucleolar RNA-associated protein 18